ncbi:MAG TPA: Asp-tRNA(Asn)/Glu-tRNA(Gln) amidotransferase subunit GatC [Spirochaetota bacterium]|nr:Asp-tRNA(Asn)/Glu-tRNA(Gln) amidotransferase subunit GatC [Spirochaetota bacterium]OPZ39206.1 MAG: Aspartyl/glutamyl-tRNA(Asn/Gln) amidotransferase subunit C [Spirochaetes bacterium ADurb.BinA120]HNU92243.1 Asp-tRNA(Asn)/Glu-tRNA(Gln) amidotransferase subunit GatC [Spirochaetota bacterium]HPI13853.1 Asp-tRNA(Asn)/Glu-tRNA(Gln) amidotransferase subunit GatC [Spirochaetota bacterium]HPO45253.1 Asp-tRNA(Asn)/Glu-tRNA(Gln) amidotransferase subunit GatC [Spirochaetota bacterium]
MSTMDEKQILRVARLARLDLSEQEMSEYARQLNDILAYVRKIEEMETANVRPTDHIVDLHNVFREDRVQSSPGAEALRAIAPRFEDGHVVVPIIIEGQE